MEEGKRNAVAELAVRLEDIERQVDAIRLALAGPEARRLPPVTKLASKLAGREVSAEVMRKRGRERRDEVIAHLSEQEKGSDGKR